MKKQPIDVAVWLGLIPPELPPILTYEELVAKAPEVPPEIISGMLHQGCKMVLGGTSKSNKSWCLIELAVSVAAGSTWWGRKCSHVPVLYLNFELQEWAVAYRIQAIRDARPDLRLPEGFLSVWNLRGEASDISTLRTRLQRHILRHNFGLIILDPAYKLLGDRDENSNGDITSMMNEFEALCAHTGAALVIAHHFAKGDASVKDPIDRISGAGAWARDPDSILIMTPHEEENCFTVTSILRNFPPVPEFVLEWDLPVMREATHLNPDAIRTRQSARKVCTDHEFVERFISDGATTRQKILEECQKEGISRTSTDRYLKRLVDSGLISSGQGLYWRPKA